MNENKLKHLEFIQNVITRMNTNSFMIKGWMVTLVSALFALATKDADIRLLYVTFFPIPFFWALDAFYLSQERQFRGLYSEVSKKPENAIDFSMDKSAYDTGKNSWCGTLVAPTIWLVYLSALVLVFILAKYLIRAT